MCGRCAYKLTWRKSRRFTTLGPPPHNFQIRYNECLTTNIDNIIGNDEIRLFV